MQRCKQWPRQNLNCNEYGSYYFYPYYLDTMTTWAWMGLGLFPACYQITLASCPCAGTQKFHKVCIKSVLLSLAFFVGIIFCCWIPLIQDCPDLLLSRDTPTTRVHGIHSGMSVPEDFKAEEAQN